MAIHRGVGADRSASEVAADTHKLMLGSDDAFRAALPVGQGDRAGLWKGVDEAFDGDPAPK